MMVQQIKRILVPLDGSSRAEQALKFAVHIARATDGTVILLQVGELLSREDFAAAQAEQKDVNAYLAGVIADYKRTEKSVELVVAQPKTLTPSTKATGTVSVETESFPSIAEDTADTILKWAEAEENEVDLIVLCRHGNNGYERPLGSVAHKIVLHSHRSKPVLLVHEESLEFKGYDAHALVALDGSTFSETVLAPAAYLVDALGTPEERERVRQQKGTLPLHFIRVVKESPKQVVKVLDDSFEQGEKFDDGTELELDTAIIKLRRVKETFNDNLGRLLVIQADGFVVKGEDAAETLVKTAESGEDTGLKSRYDLLALATHGEGGLLHWVQHGLLHRDLGSVAEHVINATKLPILIVRPH
jgi:nucleotide-binding universal stress UspA family protein